MSSQITPSNDDMELRKLALEESRLRQERELKEQELSVQRDQLSKSRFVLFGREIPTVAVTLMIGVITVIGGVFGSLLTGRQNLSLERERFAYQKDIENSRFQFQREIEQQKADTELILSAIKTGDRDSAVANLLFLLDVGLLKDSTGKIAELRKNPELAPVLPSSSNNSVTGEIRPPITRGAVRSGSDVDAASVDMNPKPVTVEQMIEFERPSDLPLQSAPRELGDKRHPPVETSVYTLEAHLISYKLEVSGDLHLILEGPSGRTMIAVIPDPKFVPASSPFAKRIAAARAAFQRHFETSTLFKTADVQVRVTGIGYFSFVHGQRGVAPNGIELHPVLDIEFLSH